MKQPPPLHLAKKTDAISNSLITWQASNSQLLCDNMRKHRITIGHLFSCSIIKSIMKTHCNKYFIFVIVDKILIF